MTIEIHWSQENIEGPGWKKKEVLKDFGLFSIFNFDLLQEFYMSCGYSSKDMIRSPLSPSLPIPSFLYCLIAFFFYRNYKFFEIRFQNILFFLQC